MSDSATRHGSRQVAEYPRLEYPRMSAAAWLHMARLLVT